MSLDSDVYAASCLIKRKPIKNLIKYYQNFYHIYPFTTENLSEYFTQLDLKDKSILTTGSSADQILNAISMGCKNITCFDINPFVKYYYDLKVAAIENLGYDQFVNFFSITYLDKTKTKIKLYDGFQKETYCTISSSLPSDSKTFWDTLFYHFSSDEIKAGLFFPMKLSLKQVKEVNKYLDENEYYKLRTKIKDSDVKFIRSDLRDIKYKLTEKYDYIILSNILQYIQNFRSTNALKQLKRLLLNLENNLKENGQIEVCYIYNYSERIKNNDEYIKYYNLAQKKLGNSKTYYLPVTSVSKKKLFSLKKDFVFMYKKDIAKVYKNDSL